LNDFFFSGGIHQVTAQVAERMFLFVLTPQGEEFPLIQSERMGFVFRDRGSSLYSTNMSTIKLFLDRRGYGQPTWYYSFFLSFNSEAPKITIYGFAGEGGNQVFSANANLLKKAEVLSLPMSEESREFLKYTRSKPPIDTLRRLVKIEYPDPKKNLRKVFIPK
jgi:hypothetical protein